MGFDRWDQNIRPFVVLLSSVCMYHLVRNRAKCNCDGIEYCMIK